MVVAYRLGAVAFTMRAACPAARAAHAGGHLRQSNPYTALASLDFFGFFNPANPLVAGQWRNTFPEFMHFWHRTYRLLKILGQHVYRSLCQSLCHISILTKPPVAHIARAVRCVTLWYNSQIANHESGKQWPKRPDNHFFLGHRSKTCKHSFRTSKDLMRTCNTRSTGHARRTALK